MSKLVLFDIDGTLVLSGGAGLRAMTSTFEEIFQVRDGLVGLQMAGGTDTMILDEAVARLGLEADGAVRARFHERYCVRLTQEILLPGSRKGVMPGVRELLDVLSGRNDVVTGLLTGNFAKAARIKLEYFGLWRYFPFGAYGDDAPERDRLAEIAIERARARGAPALSPPDVLIVGDTPRDVACAASTGARAVAVATGPFDETTLRASGADVVFADLSDTAAFLSLLES